jgi:site-specific DNA-methyltransferase (adenine-specific)
MLPPWQLLAGDHRANPSPLSTLAEGTFDACVTDAPYELGFMGKKWDCSGIAYDGPFWAEVRRVLKPGAHLVCFGGTRTYHRMASAVEDAGFKIRDQLAWVFGSGFPKSHNLAGAHAGWGTALKPAWEPIVLARKPLIGTVAANVARHGTGALHIEACRIGEAEIKTMGGSKGGTVAEFGFSKEFSGSAHLGRWPANLAHDGSPEVVALFPAEAGAASPVAGDEPSDLFGHGICSPRERVPGVFHADTGSAARFFYCAKASAADREAGLSEAITTDGRTTSIDNACLRGETTRRNTHPTVKPTALMRWLVRLVTPMGGHVLDPFNGSGSTGVACLLEGMRYTGIEREAPYLAISRARLTEAAGPLFAHQPTSPPAA